MAVTTHRKEPAVPAGYDVAEAGIRISDAATRVGVSARTLRYYEELGLLTPSLYTAGGERRYTLDDLAHLQRILELREVLGMNLDEIREFLSLETRLDQLRASYRATKGATTKKAQAEQRATLQEAMELNESLARADQRQARPDGRLPGQAPERCRSAAGSSSANWSDGTSDPAQAAHEVAGALCPLVASKPLGPPLAGTLAAR